MANTRSLKTATPFLKQGYVYVGTYRDDDRTEKAGTYKAGGAYLVTFNDSAEGRPRAREGQSTRKLQRDGYFGVYKKEGSKETITFLPGLDH